MSNTIKLSVDVSKLDKNAFIQGKKGTYVVLVITETPDNEFSTHVAFQDMGKDQNGEFIKSPIVGSAKRWDKKESVESDNLPF